jgi:hypothetical protein
LTTNGRYLHGVGDGRTPGDDRPRLSAGVVVRCSPVRWCSLIALWLAPVAAHATVLADWSLEEVVGHADRVVIGVVVEQRAERGDRYPRTETAVRVERVLRGADVERFTVTQYGGQFGDLVVRIPGDPRLRVGQRLLLITRRARDGRDYLVGMSLGVYQVVGERLRQSIDVPVLGDGGELRPPPGLRWLRLEDVEAAVRRSP